jgi:arylformamidase
MPEFIDISPLISPDVAVWPGDVAFSRQVALDMQSGDNLTLSSITTTLHVGAHCDAPNHYAKDGESIAERDLDPYYGPCQIVTVDVARGERIVPSHIKVEIQAERVLFKTLTFPNPNDFNEDFASLSPEVVEFLFEKGVRLVGLDTPSVDLCKDRELLSHNAIAKRNLSILEGVVLGHVEDGVYTLIALPLKLAQADASPVRAVLVRI